MNQPAPLMQRISASLLVSALLLAAPFTSATRAADHGDAPALAQDLGSDINDVFLFLDPTDNTQTVMIATVHGFLVPGEVPNFAVFDENVRYRFEVYNNHVNLPSPVFDPSATAARKANFVKAIKPARTIDVTFSKRQVGDAAQSGTGGGAIPPNLRRALPQQATVTLTGFKGLSAVSFRTDVNGNPLLVTPFNFSSSAPAFDVRNIKASASATVQFFAGEVDDPFFFDLPAFNNYLDGARNGGAPNTSAFFRQRDTFAGYNTLAIAIRIPTALLLSEAGPSLGLDFLTQRHINEVHTPSGVRGLGAYKTIDRMGNPGVNVILIPFDKKNSYNSGTPKADAQLLFAPIITESLKELGLNVTTPEPSFIKLANIALAYGDILRLDTSISNFASPSGVGFPNGRRLHDDTVDFLLTAINHDATLGDGVANSGTGPQAVGTAAPASFPFLGKPNQPLANGSTDPTQN